MALRRFRTAGGRRPIHAPRRNPLTPVKLPSLKETPRRLRSRDPLSPKEASLRFLDALFAGQPPPHVAVTLWDGTRWPDAGARAATLQLKHPASLRRMFSGGTEKALAEAYLHDDFEIVGEFEAAFEIADALRDGAGWSRSLSLAHLLHQLPDGESAPAAARPLFSRRAHRHSLARDRAAVSFHYDVSNDFYKLWLDPHLIYSCAYFQAPGQSLAAAQAAKLDHLCRKLRLAPGQRVLDIGCGWGGLALHAARHYGAHVTGVTLSERQHAEGTARVAAAGLGDRVRLLLRDYRELDAAGEFDAVVSVGMAEHVGVERLPEYFSTVHRLLRPRGAFLNHAIGEGIRYRASAGPSFIDEYVFPDTDLPPIRRVAAEAEAAEFEVRDVENLREHYALTLRHWGRRLAAHHEEALAFVNEPTYRVWRLYMAGSALGFEQGRLAIYQTLLIKLDADGRSGLPLTRRDWYAALADGGKSR